MVFREIEQQQRSHSAILPELFVLFVYCAAILEHFEESGE